MDDMQLCNNIYVVHIKAPYMYTEYLHIFIKGKELDEISQLYKSKTLYNHKNAFEKNEEYPNKTWCTVNSKE